MNKKAFIGATLITATVVGGVVYYRHHIMNQVARALDPELRTEGPVKDVFVAGFNLTRLFNDPEKRQKIEEYLAKAEQEGYLTGAQMHEKFPNKFDERGRLIRKQEPTA